MKLLPAFSRFACLGLLFLCLARPAWAEPWFFVQLSDPQFGFLAKNENCLQETANFEFAMATANRFKPAFVIVTGDLVNKAQIEAQGNEYLRITKKLDRSIPLYQLPGNHDVGNDPKSEDIATYITRFGPDHYTFRHGKVMGLALNSCLIYSSKNVPKEAAQQEAWLKAELVKARREGVTRVIVFQHHPWFVADVDEPDAYHNLPRESRRRYLDLFIEHGVTHVFAGHYHANAVARYRSLEMVTTGAIGKPLRKDVSGMRVVIVRDNGVEHRFYHMGEIPNQIELATAKGVGSRGR